VDKKRLIDFCQQATEVSLWLVIFSIPISIAMTNIGIGFSVFFWLIKKILNKDWRLIQNPINIFLVLLLLISIFSIIHSIRISSSLQGIQKLLKYFTLFFIITETINDTNKLRRVIWVLFLGLTIISLDGVFQYFTGKDFIRGYIAGNRLCYMGEYSPPRLQASMHNPNSFAVYLITVIPLAISLALYYFKSIKSWIVSSIWLTAYFCMFHTYQRIVGLAFIIIMSLFSIIKKDIRAILLLLLIIFLSVYFLPRPVLNWMVNHPNPHDFIVEEGGRRLHWQAAINMIKAHPLIGVGINTFPLNYTRYKISSDTMTGWYAHNAYLNMAAEIGLIGLGIFILMLGTIIRNWWRSYKKIDTADLQAFSLGIFGGFIGYLVAGILESNLQYSNLAVLFWFSLGILVAMINLQVQQSPNKT